MLHDGITLFNSSVATNFQIQNGAQLPSTGLNVGELFYLTGGAQPGLYIYDGSAWVATGGDGGGTIDFDGLNVKQAARVATSSNITLSGLQTVDDVSLVDGNRVLVRAQTTPSQNGIYIVGTSSWQRAPDFDGSPEVKAGDFVFITEGTQLADTGWVLTTNAPITVGTTGLTFAQFTGGTSASAGASGTIQLSNGLGGFTASSLTASGNTIASAGAITIQPLQTGVDTGFNVNVTAGLGRNASTGGAGGSLLLTAGAGGTGTTGNAGNGGALQLYGGNAGTNGNWPGHGGWVQLYGGAPYGGGTPGSIAIHTNGTERFRISDTGAFGLSGATYGTSGQVLTSQGSGSAPIWTTIAGGSGGVTLDTVQTITANKAFTAKILAGHTSSIIDYVGNESRIQVAGAGGGDSRVMAATYSNDSIGPAFVLMKSRSATIGSGFTAAQAGDSTGSIVWAASNGSAFVRNTGIASFAESTGSLGTGVPGYLSFYTAPASAPNTTPERMRINSVGQVMVGMTSPVTQANASQAGLSVGSTEAGQSRMAGSIFRNDATSAGLTFTKSRGATVGTHGLAQNGDGLGFILFEGSTGTAYARGANISVTIDGTPSATSMPAQIVLFTTPAGTTAPVERLAIRSSGAWSVNASTGTAGQALVSNGSGSSPTWQTLPNTTALERTTTFDANARGKRVVLTAGVTIPANTYVGGDGFSFYNSTASTVTITQGSGLTLRRDGTATVGNLTLAGYGTCVVWFNTATEAIATGSFV